MLSTFVFAIALIASASATCANDVCDNVTQAASYIDTVKVDGVHIWEATAVEGDEILVKVAFFSGMEDSEVTVEVGLDAKKDVQSTTKSFTVLANT